MEEGKIVSDTDFLSAFLKIDRLDLVFKALETDEIIIPRAVYEELEESPYTNFFELLKSKENKISIKNIKNVSTFEGFGRGELECISLAEKTNSLLLMDDRDAGKIAKNKGITVMEIPAFLIQCRKSNVLSKEEIKEIIKNLKEKDFYEFNKEIKEKLLK